MMLDKEAVIEKISEAFGANHYPGDNFLQGSFEGSEPYDEIEPFKGQDDWQKIDPVLLDAHYAALSFFSEAALRFFLPAYLVADVRDQLQTADPLFTLVHGFSDLAVELQRNRPEDQRRQQQHQRDIEPAEHRRIDRRKRREQRTTTGQ